MAKSVLELAVGTGQWDAGLKKGKQSLDNFIQANGGLQSALNKESASMQKFVQMMGQMDSQAKTAKGQMNDYKGTIEALTMQYNRMTDAQKAAIGQDYLNTIDQMRQKYHAVAEEVQKINQSLSQTPNADALSSAMPSGGSLFSSDKLSGMLQVFGGNVMTKLAGVGVGFASEMKDMVAQGIELAKTGEGVRLAFQRLGRGDILQGLREATHGTVTDLELMKAAVKFNDFKLPLDELGTMLAFAQQKAKDTGQSVDYMVDSIVTGLGRKSLMILDNLGLSAAEIKEKMAETGDMTKAVGEIIREQMAKAGDYVETAADRATQANVSLQNKMEELGRKFAPLQEASNNMWTSMKIGILDVVGGPLAKMLNSLTEAGRLMNALSSNNGEQGSGNTKVDQQLNKLRGSNHKQFYYNKVVENYTKQINDLQAQINNGGKKPGAGSGTSQDVRYLTAQKQSLEVMFGLFKSGAKDIMQPVKVDIKTDDAEQNVVSLTNKLKDLQAQRKKAIAAGDTELSKNLLKQINQTKADIKGLRGGTTTTTTTHQTPQQRAQESFTKAEQNYKQALEQAAMELQAGTITRAEAKKKEMQAAETRWKAIGDARNINDSENLRKAQDEAAAEYKRLAAEAKTAAEHQKAVDKATRDLENANQKLATARTEMAHAKQQGDLQAYNTAKDKATAAQQEITRLEKVKVDVETGRVDLPDIPATTTTTVDFQANTRNIDAAISDVKKEMDTIPVGTIEFNLDQTKLVDLTTLKTLISEQMKNGLQIDPNFAQSMFSNILAGKDIENTTWQAQVDNINKNRTANGLDPLKIDYKTGEKENGKDTKKLTDEISTLTSGLSSIAGGLKSMGIDLPEEVDQVIGVIQGVTSVIEGVNAIISIFSTSAMSANTAALIANTIALNANTVTSFLPFANGGVVPTFAQGGLIGRAAGGMMIPGNSMSGDHLRLPVDGGRGMIGVNSGELILNRAQQGIIASQLEGGIGAMQLSAIITGEQLRLVLNNNGRRTGRGEYVTTNFR